MNQQPAFNNNRSNEVIRNGNNPQYYQPMPRNQQPVVYHNQNQPFSSTSINQQFSNPPQQKPYPYHPSEGSFIKGVNKTDYVFGKIP